MRPVIQVVLLLLLLIHLGGPLFETVDHWDGFAQGGDDFVLGVLGVVVGLGLSLLLAFFLRWALPALRESSLLSLAVLFQGTRAFLEAAQPAPLTSPPRTLRI